MDRVCHPIAFSVQGRNNGERIGNPFHWVLMGGRYKVVRVSPDSRPPIAPKNSPDYCRNASIRAEYIGSQIPTNNRETTMRIRLGWLALLLILSLGDRALFAASLVR